MERESPTTAHPTLLFPTAAMMDLEDLCPLQVRTFEPELTKQSGFVSDPVHQPSTFYMGPHTDDNEHYVALLWNF